MTTAAPPPAPSASTSGRTFDGAPTPARERGRFQALLVLGGGLYALLFVSPLLWAVVRSFMTNEAITAPLSARSFTGLSLQNYAALLGGGVDILPYLGNSVVVSVSTALATAVIATLAGYAIGRFPSRFVSISFAVILLALMVPFQAIITPLFLEFHALGLSDSRLGLVIFYVTFNLPFGVFVMRNAFAAVPKELEESAYVDGCGIMSTLWRVMRPFVLPGVATTVLYTFLTSWTEFFGALTLLTSDSKLTLPVALTNVQNGSFGTINFGYLVAGAVLSMIPTVILYIAFQRYYVGGLTSGSVKG